MESQRNFILLLIVMGRIPPRDILTCRVSPLEAVYNSAPEWLWLAPEHQLVGEVGVEPGGRTPEGLSGPVDHS